MMLSTAAQLSLKLCTSVARQWHVTLVASVQWAAARDACDAAAAAARV